MYPADSKETIKLLEKYITTFGFPQQLIHDNGSAFMSNDFAHWSSELGKTLRPRTTYSPWTNGKFEVQNKHLTQYFRHFLSTSGSNWSELTNKTIDKSLKNLISAEILKRENDFKLIHSNSYSRCRRITNKAHMFRNQFKLGRPIKEGTKVLLENRYKPLLKSQKLLNLRSGPYTVIEKITEVTYGIQKDFTNE